jgi:uncharacterized tellurite resistance protein B-like protein
MVCRLVAGLVVADDDLDEKEDAFITRVLAKFGIPEEQRETIFPIVDRSEAATEIQSLPKDVQQEAFALLIEAAVADGKVMQEEEDYLLTVAEALGIAPKDMYARLEKALAG